MKAVLEFNLPEEQEEFKLMQQASYLSCVIHDLNEFLRSKVKYAPESQSEEATEAFSLTREHLFELINKYEVNGVI